MRTDFDAYVTKMLVKQNGLNIIFFIMLTACLSKIATLKAEVKALKTNTEGESE